MRTLRRLVKLTIAHALYYSGILFLLVRIKLRGRAVVLTYHRVIADDMMKLCSSSPGIIVKKDVFEKHLKIIKNYLNPISTRQFQAHIAEKKPFPDRSCLITFDDGWLDNYEIAFPILKQYRVPAVIFLPFNYISNNLMFWQEELVLRLSHLLRSDNPDDCEFVKNLTATANSPNNMQLGEYVSKIKTKGYKDINGILEIVRSRYKNNAMPTHYNLYMSWQQIIEMQRSGIAFGSHTLSHRILTRITKEECTRELINSRTLLEAALGEPVTSIAYPNGDHDEQVEQLAKQAGYTVGFTTEHGYTNHDTNAYTIPRVNIHNNSSDSKAMFLCTIMGIF